MARETITLHITYDAAIGEQDFDEDDLIDEVCTQIGHVFGEGLARIEQDIDGGARHTLLDRLGLTREDDDEDEDDEDDEEGE